MEFLRKRSGDYFSIATEFRTIDAVNPRLIAFLLAADMFLTNVQKSLYIIGLSRTPQQHKNRHRGIESALSFHLQRPCSACDFRIQKNKPLSIQDGRLVKQFFDKYFACVRGDLCRIVDKPSRHLHAQMVYLPGVQDKAIVIDSIVAPTANVCIAEED